MARWQDFEKLASTILAELQPAANVVWNDKVYGHLTHTKRQVDVTIRWKDRNDEYLAIVQAKDSSTPADIGVVDEFASVIRDVRAQRGILICRSGFTKAAHKYARNCGISLINIHDAQSINWSLQLTIPILWVELTPAISTQAVVAFEAGDVIPTNDPLGLPLSTDDGKTRIDPMSTFKRYWNGGDANRTIGSDHFVLSDRPVKAIAQDATKAIVMRDVQDFVIKYTVDQKAWLGQFRPSDCRGIVDYLNHSAFIASYLPISEIPFQRDASWEAIDDMSKVALSLRGTIVTTQMIVLVDNLTSQELSVTYLGPERPDANHRQAMA